MDGAPVRSVRQIKCRTVVLRRAQRGHIVSNFVSVGHFPCRADAVIGVIACFGRGWSVVTLRLEVSDHLLPQFLPNDFAKSALHGNLPGFQVSSPKCGRLCRNLGIRDLLNFQEFRASFLQVVKGLDGLTSLLAVGCIIASGDAFQSIVRDSLAQESHCEPVLLARALISLGNARPEADAEGVPCYTGIL